MENGPPIDHHLDQDLPMKTSWIFHPTFQHVWWHRRVSTCQTWPFEGTRVATCCDLLRLANYWWYCKKSNQRPKKNTLYIYIYIYILYNIYILYIYIFHLCHQTFGFSAVLKQETTRVHRLDPHHDAAQVHGLQYHGLLTQSRKNWDAKSASKSAVEKPKCAPGPKIFLPLLKLAVIFQPECWKRGCHRWIGLMTDVFKSHNLWTNMFIIGDHDPISIHFYGAKPTSWHLWHHNMATRLETTKSKCLPSISLP